MVELCRPTCSVIVNDWLTSLFAVSVQVLLRGFKRRRLHLTRHAAKRSWTRDPVGENLKQTISAQFSTSCGGSNR